jgi:hypothetical protein
MSVIAMFQQLSEVTHKIDHFPSSNCRIIKNVQTSRRRACRY